MTERPTRRPLRTFPRERDDQGRPANARPRDRFGRPLERGSHDEMVHRQDPENVVESVDEALDVAARLFDDERFFEAHEFLEFVWKHPDTRPGDRDFWKGVTQVAVGCCHTQRGNAEGALTLLHRASGHLASYPARYEGIDASALVAAAEGLAQEVEREGASPQRRFPRLPLVGATESGLGDQGYG